MVGLLVFETIFMDHRCLKIDDQNRITLPSYLNRTLDGNALFGCCTCFCKKGPNCDDNFLVFKIHHESGLFSSLKPPIWQGGIECKSQEINLDYIPKPLKKLQKRDFWKDFFRTILLPWKIRHSASLNSLSFRTVWNGWFQIQKW